jgi:TRAP transporter TAXI family solute receptor
MSFGFAMVTLLTLFSPIPARAAELVPFITPPAGGGAYVLGAGMVSVTNRFLPGATLVHEAASGTMDIVRRMMYRDSTKKDCFGIFGTVDAWNALQGKNEYSGRPFSNLRAVVYATGTDLYLVVPANSSIKSYADVKGKRIGMGGPGSTVANTAHFLLDQSGVAKKDFKPYYFTYSETVQGIQDGSLDGGFVAGGYPIPSYTELANTHKVRIVSIDEQTVKKATSEHPYYYRNVVKAKSYKGVEQDVLIMGFTTAVFTLASVDSDFIYKFLKNLFDHRTEYYSIHTSAKDLTPEDATKGVPVPFHPGAEKYLREIGAMKK